MGPVPVMPGTSYTLPASGTDTLYAQWDPNTVTLAYARMVVRGLRMIRVVIRSVM